MIAAEDDFQELMYVQATVADPRFKLAKSLSGKEVGKADLEEFVDMGRRLQLTAKRLPEFRTGDDFKSWATKLGKQAAMLEGYARSGEGQKAVEEALAIKKTCAGCHAEHR